MTYILQTFSFETFQLNLFVIYMCLTVFRLHDCCLWEIESFGVLDYGVILVEDAVKGFGAALKRLP